MITFVITCLVRSVPSRWRRTACAKPTSASAAPLKVVVVSPRRSEYVPRSKSAPAPAKSAASMRSAYTINSVCSACQSSNTTRILHPPARARASRVRIEVWIELSGSGLRAGGVQRQSLRAAHQVRVDVVHARIAPFEAREARQQLLERDARLEARQRRAQTEVDPEAKRHVSLRIARDVEAIRVRELCFVAVGRAQQRDHCRAGGDLHTGELDVLRGLAEQELDRTVVAQRLLDQRRDAVRVAAHPHQLVGIVHQREERVAE